ncbi:hypothetical protein [Streptomyces sp. PA5.6]|uniref:hypothetical protein n=1 Tax=Streptomyces sp. PA5.6 TaxID=3035651 RepID=UPI003904C38F
MSDANPTWRVNAIGYAKTMFTYEVEAPTEADAKEAAYAIHGRRLREGDVSEALSPESRAAQLGVSFE